MSTKRHWLKIPRRRMDDTIDIDDAVDFRRIELGARNRRFLRHFIDQHA